MEATASSTADVDRRKVYLAAILFVAAALVIFFGAVLIGMIKHELMAAFFRGAFGGLVTTGVFRIWFSAFPPPRPPMAVKLSAEAGCLIRQWTDEKGQRCEDRQAMRAGDRIVQWVGAEEGFMEIFWRDGTRWCLNNVWFGPTGVNVTSFWQAEGIEVQIERLGIVLRKADPAAEDRSVVQA